MDEREMLTYFDIVDLVDKILPPKSELDYTKLSVVELLERFDKIIEEGGYHFREELLVACRQTLANLQKFNTGRTSNFVGGQNAENFDQNNYGIQNRLSEMRVSLINSLSKPIDYKFRGEVFDTFALGGIDKIKPRVTKEKVKEYITEVLSSSWEESDTLRLEEHMLATDILSHFGINEREDYGSVNFRRKLSDLIGRMEYKSRDFIGPIDREGNYQRSETNRFRHPAVLQETIDTITSFVYQRLQDVIQKTEARDARFADEKKRAEERRTRKSVGAIIQESNYPHDVSIRPPRPEKKEEPVAVSTEELEETRDKYEEVQAIAKENAELAQELEELKRKTAEIEARIQANTDRMIKVLQKQ